MIALVPYATDDFDLLVRVNSPAMTEHLGGPESEAALLRRHHRYLALDPSAARMYRIAWGAEAVGVGVIGFWARTWRGELVWETGWSVLPEYQGRGIAKAATRALVVIVRANGRHRWLHAFPAVDNPASNAICRAVGFEFVEASDFEYPVGHVMRCNDWRQDLELD